MSPDSVRVDSAGRPQVAPPEEAVGPLPGELAGSLQDTTEAERPFPRLATELDVPAEGYAAAVYDWDREAILASNAFTLLDLLAEAVPGLTPVRANWFGGPHQVLNGALGPGFLSVSVDGRELTPIDAGQVDLTRIALAYVDRVRVRRRSDGWVAEVTTLNRSAARAYSRITGGTGDPGLSRLRLVFSNSAGRTLNFGATADLLDAGGERSSSDFDFWGNVEWTPGEDGAGVELHFGTESLDRTVYEAAELGRKELFVRGRGNLASWLQAEAFAGTTELTEGGEKVRDIDNAGFNLTGAGERGWFRTGLRLWDSEIFPQVDVDADVGFRPTRWLGLEVGGRVSGWDGFTTSEGRAAIAFTGLPLGGLLTFHGSTGKRGVSYPTLGTADTLSFEAAAGMLGFSLGPFRLSERVEYQYVDRQLPFGSIFDRGMPAGDPLELVAFETGLEGPILPINLLVGSVSPIMLSGFWRYTSLRSLGKAAYLPQNIVRGELYFADEFFEGNLGLRLALSVNRRDPMLVSAGPAPPEEDPLVEVPSYTFLDWNMMIRILEVRIYWRYENVTNKAGQDLPNLVFPNLRNVFGVKWEFLN